LVEETTTKEVSWIVLVSTVGAVRPVPPEEFGPVDPSGYTEPCPDGAAPEPAVAGLERVFWPAPFDEFGEIELEPAGEPMPEADTPNTPEPDGVFWPAPFEAPGPGVEPDAPAEDGVFCPAPPEALELAGLTPYVEPAAGAPVTDPDGALCPALLVGTGPVEPSAADPDGEPCPAPPEVFGAAGLTPEVEPAPGCPEATGPEGEFC
jgi:hypothetical protein